MLCKKLDKVCDKVKMLEKASVQAIVYSMLKSVVYKQNKRFQDSLESVEDNTVRRSSTSTTNEKVEQIKETNYW